MSDTDQTNIYSYKGTDYAGDLMAYLTAHGLKIISIEMMQGMTLIETETVVYNIPQYAQWNSIAEYIKEGGR